MDQISMIGTNPTILTLLALTCVGIVEALKPRLPDDVEPIVSIGIGGVLGVLLGVALGSGGRLLIGDFFIGLAVGAGGTGGFALLGQIGTKVQVQSTEPRNMTVNIDDK